MVWARNLLFGVLCLAGLLAIGGSLLERSHIKSPRDFYGGQSRVIATTPVSSVPPASLPTKTTSGSQAEQKIWPSREPKDFAVVVARINQEHRQDWENLKLEPAERADDLTIARRLSLALTGTVPSVEEIRALEQVNPDDRVEWWVAHLLEDRRYADYVAERLARAYVGTVDGPFVLYRRRRFVTWLADHLDNNTPYNSIVEELIADTGLWNASPAVNFVTVTAQQDKGNEPSEIRLAGRTTRAFLGMRIDCLECHDDKLGNIVLGEKDNPHLGKQTDFHQLAAFFSQTTVQLTGVRDDQKQKYDYKYLKAEKEVVVPAKVPFGQEIFDGRGTRREQLARWVTNPQNKPFARATVNRIWALLYGKPLVAPVDDIPLYGKYPPPLETLADDFIAHNYDLKRLIRLIAASDAYQRDSQADFEITSEHEDHYAAFPITRMRPEQVAGSVIQASSLTTINADAHILSQIIKALQSGEFVQRYGDMGEDEFIDRGGTIPQRLLMMNGELVKGRTDQNFVQNAASRITMVTAKPEKAVETAYLAILTRRPTERESAHFVARLNDRTETNRVQNMEDLYWVLLNSTEFSWNH